MWQNSYANAEKIIREEKFEAAIDTIKATLVEIEKSKYEFADHFLASNNQLLSQAYFKSKNLSQALEVIVISIQLYEKSGDHNNAQVCRDYNHDIEQAAAE